MRFSFRKNGFWLAIGLFFGMVDESRFVAFIFGIDVKL